VSSKLKVNYTIRASTIYQQILNMLLKTGKDFKYWWNLLRIKWEILNIFLNHSSFLD